jgi:uncharacterized protein YhfF
VPASPERVCEFASPGPLRDRLVAAVLAGDKTATTSLLLEWEDEAEPLPVPGERQRVIDSGGRTVAVIEIVAVDVVALGDIDLDVAVAEGEGDTSVAQWRAAHEGYWRAEVMPRFGGGAGPIGDELQVVVERFRLTGAR